MRNGESLEIHGRRLGAPTYPRQRNDERCSRGRHQYVRDTDGVLADHLAGAYDATASLPPAAVDLGYVRDGRSLWSVEGRAVYLVSVDDPSDVERWPVAKDPIACL